MNSTAIQWTDKTWNPVTGCDRISPGCAHCYAKQLHDMRHKAWLAGWTDAPEQYHTPFETVQLHPDRIDALPLRGAPCKVFVNSMSDLFHQDVPDEFIDRVFAAMALRPHMTFQILTKRAKRMALYLGEDKYKNAGRHGAILGTVHFQTKRKYPDGRDLFEWPLPNVWLGVSVENQKYADERIPWLLKTPAAVRFLSVEPLLGPVDFSAWIYHNACGCTEPHIAVHTKDCPHCKGTAAVSALDWVIAGGESGAGARPMHPDWARGIRDQCQAAGVPFFFKQWGEFGPVFPPPFVMTRINGDDIAGLGRIGVDRAGRQLDGREWNEFPEVAEVVR